MTSRLTIGWVRHGITEWNQLGKIQGVTDIPLSSEGVAQAHRLAERLAQEGFPWTGVVSSDLSRASHTAEILAHRLNLPLVTDPLLRERSFGAAEGTTELERISRWGTEWRKNVPDQENDDSVRARGLAFVTALETNHPGEAWLVVTHGSFLARVLQALCADLSDHHLGNMSLTILEQSERGWMPLLHNCTEHLSSDMKV